MKISHALVGLTSEYITRLECIATREWEIERDLDGGAFFISLFNNSSQITECINYINDVIDQRRTINDDIVLDYWSLHIYDPICEIWEQSKGAENLYCQIHVDDLKSMLEILIRLWRQFEDTHVRVIYDLAN